MVEFYGDTPPLELYTGGQVVQLLVDHADRRFYQELRTFQAFLPHSIEHRRHLPPAAHFVVGIVALRNAFESGDERVAIGKTARANPLRDAGCHDLLGPARTDA